MRWCSAVWCDVRHLEFLGIELGRTCNARIGAIGALLNIALIFIIFFFIIIIIFFIIIVVVVVAWAG